MRGQADFIDNPNCQPITAPVCLSVSRSIFPPKWHLSSFGILSESRYQASSGSFVSRAFSSAMTLLNSSGAHELRIVHRLSFRYRRNGNFNGDFRSVESVQQTVKNCAGSVFNVPKERRKFRDEIVNCRVSLPDGFFTDVF